MLRITTGTQQLKSVKMMANTRRASVDSLLRLALDSPFEVILRCDLKTVSIMKV